jgi:hypothetical protein
MPWERRKLAEGKSCGKTTQRLSYLPGVDVRVAPVRIEQEGRRRVRGYVSRRLQLDHPRGEPLLDGLHVDERGGMVDGVEERYGPVAHVDENQPQLDRTAAGEVDHECGRRIGPRLHPRGFLGLRGRSRLHGSGGHERRGLGPA